MESWEVLIAASSPCKQGKAGGVVLVVADSATTTSPATSCLAKCLPTNPIIVMETPGGGEAALLR
jgi:hypothetical protein